MANTNTVLAVAAGLALGAGITYMVLDKRAQAAPKKKAPDIPPGPGPEGGLPGGQGTGQQGSMDYYRDPLPNTAVNLPTTLLEHKELKSAICRAVLAFEEPPSPPDVSLTTLQDLAPQVAWPSVPGDHPTIIALQAMVMFRVDQLAYADDTRSPQENLAEACKPGLSLHPAPTPEEPDNGGGPQWQPPGG